MNHSKDFMMLLSSSKERELGGHLKEPPLFKSVILFGGSQIVVGHCPGKLFA